MDLRLGAWDNWHSAKWQSQQATHSYILHAVHDSMQATQVPTLDASSTVVQSGGGVDLGVIVNLSLENSQAKTCKLLASIFGNSPFSTAHRLEHEFSLFTRYSLPQKLGAEEATGVWCL